MRENALAIALHQRFLECPQYARLLARTARASQTELNLSGLTDSAKSLVLSVLLHEIKRPIFLIVPDNHIGARFHQELANLSRYPVFFYPSSEVSPYEQVLSSPDNIANQMDVLQHILKDPSEPYFVIVSARAMLQRVLDKETLVKNTLELSVGSTIDPHELAVKLARLGYTRESLVTLRGEFSIRGDIIDIYPSDGPPVRVELFGEEIESIRLFNIDNQRSIEECQTTAIPPRWWIILDTAGEARPELVARLKQIWQESMDSLGGEASETLRSVMESDIIALEAGQYPESSEYYATYAHDKFETLVHFLPKNCLIVYDEWDSLALSLKSYEEKLEKSLEEGLTTGRLLPLPRPLHLSMDDFTDQVAVHQRVFVTSLPVFGEDQGTSVVGFECLPIEKFGNQMQVVIERIRSWRKAGYSVVVSTEQPQRLLGLLREWDCPALYVPGPTEAGGGESSDAQSVNIPPPPPPPPSPGSSASPPSQPSPGSSASPPPQPSPGSSASPPSPPSPGSSAPPPSPPSPGSSTSSAPPPSPPSPGSSTSSASPPSQTSPTNSTFSASAFSPPATPTTSAPSAFLTSSARAGEHVDHANNVYVTRYGFVTGFKLDDIRLVSITDAEMFGLKRKPTVYRRPVAEKSYDRFTSVTDLKVGDYVVHIKQGIGQFTGVQRITVDKQQREYLTIQYAGEDRLYCPVDQINLLFRYRGAGDSPPRLSRLGGAEWESTKRRVKKSVKQVAEDLVNLYAMRAKQEGFQALPDTPWQYEMEEAFPYEETPDQWQSILDVKKDLESSKPMDRLICGDVGFGKTEVAIRAIFKTVMSSKQAAVLVPTTILAQQHFNTLSERFATYPIKVGLLSRFKTAKEQREVVQKLAIGECDVVVGTHRMLQKDITFKDLGLIIIDEEQRFGVGHKERLKQLRVMVDVLTMSATPIPRTLHMALSGARDMSLINTPPINRAPVKTFVGEYKLPLVRTAILHEMERSGQVYFVHNRVENIEQIAFELKQLVPEARIAIGHGQMQERELENVMLDFLAHQYDILVCTTIIESGLDIPNVNTIIINEADKLGLAQMYQLRGRVGRSDVQAYAYCLFRPAKVLSESAQNRLKAIREFTSLGSGYQIALRDMEIRGVGNILGAEQHGHMVSVGFDLYCKILEESVSELKGESVSGDADTQVDLNVTAFIPESYVSDADQRLIEYKRLADVKSERALEMLCDEWKDRFGTIPQEAKQLTSVVRLRLLAARAGVSAIKPDPQGIKLSVDFRLQQWLPVQANLPKHLATRTTYKPGQAGGHGPTPYILVRSQGISPEEQLDLLQELLGAMVANCAVKTGSA